MPGFSTRLFQGLVARLSTEENLQCSAQVKEPVNNIDILCSQQAMIRSSQQSCVLILPASRAHKPRQGWADDHAHAGPTSVPPWPDSLLVFFLSEYATTGISVKYNRRRERPRTPGGSNKTREGNLSDQHTWCLLLTIDDLVVPPAA